MSKIKTMIIEDELIIAEDVKGMLEEMDHEVIGIASDSDEAMQILARETPDIALIDIHLRGGDDGITIAKHIRDKFNIPLIFITSYADKATVERAKHVEPDGYIVKPFEKADLFTAIEIAIFNYARYRKPGPSLTRDDAVNAVIKDSIFIRKDYMLIKIRFDDLMWIKSEMNYLELFCRENKHLVRSTLKEFIEKLPSGIFLQVHKSFCVNVKYITAIDHSRVWLKNTEIPIGRSYVETIKKTLNVDI